MLTVPEEAHDRAQRDATVQATPLGSTRTGRAVLAAEDPPTDVIRMRSAAQGSGLNKSQAASVLVLLSAQDGCRFSTASDSMKTDTQQRFKCQEEESLEKMMFAHNFL